MLGLETALALAFTELGLPANAVFRVLSAAPARIAGITERHGGPVEPGRAANLCIVDPTEEWVVDPQRLASRSRNTPYTGRSVRGRVRHTVFEGVATVLGGESQR
jgi:dihydroorotase